ncbi:MAG: 30S ribosomal protein S8 [Verrucomicrobiota bacterium]|nr:30S ribosomal protein S8 [Verrucomicrobiota bacterium]|tara:strand:- start:7 stop:396 length:390 start_codon:yes stop_codon:yes gene_type:complete
MLTDPLADMLTRIRNASGAQLPEVEMPHSRLKESVARILKEQGFVNDLKVSGDKKRTLGIALKYRGRRGVIEGLQRISRPGLRRYVGAGEIPRVLGGLGMAILSTSRGVMTGADARTQKLGGEVLCYVW